MGKTIPITPSAKEIEPTTKKNARTRLDLVDGGCCIANSHVCVTIKMFAVCGNKHVNSCEVRKSMVTNQTTF